MENCQSIIDNRRSLGDSFDPHYRMEARVRSSEKTNLAKSGARCNIHFPLDILTASQSEHHDQMVGGAVVDTDACGRNSLIASLLNKTQMV